ncbi:ParA family protein [Streptomyces sp. cg40]|uniref:ParA family protein n=1 Tax=Streptomyces sp. cg40 TaxID=3419764 RepID=UPI003D019819
MARKIAFSAQKGGAGKTVSAKNIAAVFAMHGKRVLVVDLDPQANITRGLGFKATDVPITLWHLFERSDLRPENAVLVETSVKGVHLIAGHPQLKVTEAGMAVKRAVPTNGKDPIFTLRGFLAELDSQYDFIILDTPPSMSYMTINALAAADELVIPAPASTYSDAGIAGAVEAYEQAVQSYNPSLKLRGILVTRFKTTTNKSKDVNIKIGAEYSDLVIPQLIVEAVAVDEAEGLNLPVVIFDPKSPAAVGYVKVGEILLDE